MPEETVGEGLLDVSNLTLGEVDQIDHPILRRAVQRILDNTDIGPVAGFSSSLEGDETPLEVDSRSTGSKKT